MIEIDESNVVDYLRCSGRIDQQTVATAELLGWGVSNVVMRVTVPDGEDFVVKQSREQLRTETDWFSRLDRIFREADALDALSQMLPAGSVPKIVFQDREQFLFAMEALPANHLVWKGELLEARHTNPEIGQELGQLLAAAHRDSFKRPEFEATFGDRVVFEQLRVDPFYRHIVRAHPALRASMDALISEMNSSAVCLVLADFSPKNILLVPDGAGSHRISLVDFETAHFGDPAFDLGFFLSHLMLKSVLHRQQADVFGKLIFAFWHSYLDNLGDVLDSTECARGTFDRRILGHLCGCMLSRIDGTSTIDYLPDSEQQQFVREFCLGELETFASASSDVDVVLTRFLELLIRG